MRTVAELEEILAPQRRPVGSSQRNAYPGVYFAQWCAYVKIGSAANVVWRCRALNYAIPEGDVVPLAWIPVFYSDEAPNDQPSTLEYKIHATFEGDRVRGEWFRDTPKLRSFIDRWGYPMPTHGGAL